MKSDELLRLDITDTRNVIFIFFQFSIPTSTNFPLDGSLKPTFSFVYLLHLPMYDLVKKTLHETREVIVIYGMFSICYLIL